MKSAWASIEADLALTHSVSRRHQKQQRHVNEMTELSTRMRADWLRIANALEQFAEASKRVFAELVNGAALYDRMEMLEDLAFYTPRTSDLGLLGLNERNDNQP